MAVLAVLVKRVQQTTDITVVLVAVVLLAALLAHQLSEVAVGVEALAMGLM